MSLWLPNAANVRTKILEFRGFDSSIILILRHGVPRLVRNFPEMLSQAVLVGVISVGRLGVGHRGISQARASADFLDRPTRLTDAPVKAPDTRGT